MRPAGWGLGLGIAVGLGLVMGFVGTPVPGVAPPAADPTPSARRTAPPPCPAAPDPALREELAAAEAGLAALRARNTAAEGPVQPWPAEAEARLPALERATEAALAAQGLSIVELDCGELPCLLFLDGPREAAGPPEAEAAGWVAPLEAALAEGEVAAVTVRYGVRSWPDAAAEGVLLLVPAGVPMSPEAEQVAGRRIARIERDRLYETEAALQAGLE